MSGAMRRNIIKFCCGIALALGLIYGPGLLLAAENAGQPGAFLNYGAGARAIAMGRAFTGIADDVTALYWNSGGLSNLKQNQFMLQYASLIDGNSYQYLGYGHIFPTVGTLGVGLVMLSQPEAEGRNSYNEVTDSFTNREMAFLLGYGGDITPQLAIGGSFKIVNQTLMNLNSTGFGFDAGVMYRPVSFLSLGLNFQNLLAPGIKLKAEKETYPINMVFGIGFNFFNEMLRMDIDASKNMNQETIKPCFGLELAPLRQLPELCIRGGFDETEIGVGLGYEYMGMGLDYAVGFQTIQTMHKVSLSYAFGGFVFKVNAEPESFSPVSINKVSVIKIACQTKFQLKSWSLELLNEAGSSVKKYTGEGNPPSHIVWDGLEDTNTPMPDGKYKIVLIIMDVNGNSHQATDAFVRIQSLLPLGVSPVEILE